MPTVMSVLGKLRLMVRDHVLEGNLGQSRIHVSPAVEEAAILERLYEEDRWTDGLTEVCSFPVEVDAGLPNGAAFIVNHAKSGIRGRLSDTIERERLRCSNERAWQKYGPRKVSRHSR